MLRKVVLLSFCFLSFVQLVSAQTREICLFDDSIKHTYPKNVCDFIERYINECLSWDEAKYPLYKKMMDDKVLVLDGDINSLVLLTDSCQFSLTRYDDKAYEAKWDSDSTIFRMAFPIQYELLLGKNRKELEDSLYSNIIGAKDDIVTEQPYLELLPDSIVYRTVPHQNYQIPELTNTEYYLQYDSDFCIILDTAYLDYSVHNILLVPSEYNPTLRVIQLLYGHRQKEYSISLWQWLSYCNKENITLYVAIKEKTDAAYIIIMIAENKDLAYNHLIKMAIPLNFLIDENSIWDMQVSAFIPTHNLKNMYKQ